MIIADMLWIWYIAIALLKYIFHMKGLSDVRCNNPFSYTKPESFDTY